MIEAVDKIYTIFKINVTNVATPVKVNIGFVYNWGDGPDIWNPKEAQSEHKYAKPGIYTLKIKPSSKFVYTYDKQSFTQTGVHINDTNTKNMVIGLLNIGTGTNSIYRLCQDFVNLTESCRTIPEGVVYGMEAFINCSKLTRSFDKLPESMRNSTRMYCKCSSLEKAPKFPSNIKYVDQTFEDCASLIEGSDLPDTVVSAYAIHNGNRKLKYPIRLSGSSITYRYAFLNCESLLEMPDMPVGVPQTCDLESAFQNSGITFTKKIPNHINALKATFRFCKNLTKITNLPLALRDVQNCFYGCSSLERINIDYSDLPNLTNTSYMFSGCSKLTNVITGTPAIKSMKANLMYENTNLQSVTTALHTTVGLENCSGCYNGTDPKYVDGKPGNIYDFPNKIGGTNSFVTIKLNIAEDGGTFAFKKGICYSWGDGTTINEEVSELSHVYEKKGEYIVQIRPMDEIVQSENPGPTEPNPDTETSETTQSENPDAEANETGQSENPDSAESTEPKPNPIAETNKVVQLGDPTLTEPDPNVKAIEEMLYIPADIVLANLCKNCSNLKKVSSLKHCIKGDLTSIFENCKSLTEVPELNCDVIQNMNKAFAGTIIENVKIEKLPVIETISGAFSNCSNLKSLNIKMGPNLTNIDSLASNCNLLARVKLDLLQCSKEINASRIFENTSNLRPDKIQIDCEPTLKMDFSYAFYNNNFLTDYKINFIPTNMMQCFTSDKAAIYSRKDNSIQVMKNGLSNEAHTNSTLEEHKNELDSPQCIQKVHKYWEKFPELETKIIDGVNASNYCYKYCENINTFVDCNTNEETFGSLGLIPASWGGWFDTNKSVIGIQIPSGKTIHINNVSSSWIDYGDPLKTVTKEASNTYSRGGKFFLIFEGDFDIDPRSRKYVTEVCNLLPNVKTFGKDGFSDYPNLRYCCKVIENTEGNYSKYFENCCHLYNVPKIPDNAVNIDRMFTGTKITDPPTIPNSVTSMESTFDECRKLQSDTVIPNAVKNCNFAFRNCSAIKVVVGNWSSGAYASDFKKIACYRGVSATGIPEDWK